MAELSGGRLVLPSLHKGESKTTTSDPDIETIAII